jgi:hypothetical protein
MEGQVVPNNDSLDPVDLLVIYDDGSMYAYGTATPVTDPSNVGWYDVSKTDDGMMIITREVTDFMGHMDKGEKATGATCRNVAAIDPSEFELPEDAMVKNIPPGGMYQYY